MASPANSGASEVRRRGRQRLIGAIALVAVLVVFVPMVLDKEPRPQRSGPDLAIPSKTDVPPLPAPPPAASAKAPPQADSATAANAPAPSPEVGKPPRIDPRVAEARVLESSKPAPPKPPPAVVASVSPAPAPAAPPRLDGFAVQVGAFRDEAMLAQAREKLAAAKVPHYTERMEAKGGPLTRLRAGPFKTREAAESALAQLKLSALDGKVVPLP